jgi:hypothetical protein
MPSYVIVKGKDALANTYIDLLQNGGAEVTVPVGTYELAEGVVRKGKKAQTMKALMLPGKRTPTWRVEAGKSEVVRLGAPYGFEFGVNKDATKIEVVGRSVIIVGSAGEHYERLWNCVPRPEVSWRKGGTKKGSKPEKMGMVEDMNIMDEQGRRKYDWPDTFYPTNLAIELKLKEGEQIEVQLTEKKNKLFGPIESNWL